MSPDANIIFGATLKPEMEDELVITVIATGFDSAMYHDEEVTLDGATPTATTRNADTDVDDEMVKNIDMELDQAEAAESFASEPEKNIWDTPQEDDEDDTPAFLRRRKKNKQEE